MKISTKARILIYTSFCWYKNNLIYKTMKIKIKYELTSNIDGFSDVWFNSREEAEIHILDDLEWVKNKPNYSHLKHEIKNIEIEDNPKKEIFKYFLDY